MEKTRFLPELPTVFYNAILPSYWQNQGGAKLDEIPDKVNNNSSLYHIGTGVLPKVGKVPGFQKLYDLLQTNYFSNPFG